MELIHCIYCSASTSQVLSATELQDILTTSRRNNGAAGITGVLLYHSGSFFQVLEGDRPVVEALFEKIALDTRHTNAIKIIAEPIAERAFSDWTMGYPKVTAKELAEIPGLNTFFVRGDSFMQLGEGRARTLVRAFKQGKWRRALS